MHHRPEGPKSKPTWGPLWEPHGILHGTHEGAHGAPRGPLGPSGQLEIQLFFSEVLFLANKASKIDLDLANPV